jgi:hypothetical protein
MNSKQLDYIGRAGKTTGNNFRRLRRREIEREATRDTREDLESYRVKVISYAEGSERNYDPRTSDTTQTSQS